MRLYRVAELQPGHRWQRTQDEAKAAARSSDAYPVALPRAVEVPTDQRGLIDFLNCFEKDHLLPADPEPEGFLSFEQIDSDPRYNNAPPKPVEPARPNYTAQSVSIDEAWSELPIARKLHFASLAMEEARASL